MMAASGVDFDVGDVDDDADWKCSNGNTGTSVISVTGRTEFPWKTRTCKRAGRGWTFGNACLNRERCSGSAALVCCW